MNPTDESDLFVDPPRGVLSLPCLIADDETLQQAWDEALAMRVLHGPAMGI